MTAQELEILLTERVQRFDLKKTAFDNLHKILSEDTEDSLGDFEPNEISFLFDGYQYLIDRRYSQPIIRTRIGLYVENEIYLHHLKPIGYYELETDLDGEVLNDWFVIQ